MATVTEIKLASKDSRLISYPEHITGVNDVSIHIIRILQSTLELEKLLELFNDELSNVVSHDYLLYQNQQELIKFSFGKSSIHSLNYRFKLCGNDLGTLTISRTTKILDEEVDRIETLLSAIIYPLRNALLYKQALEKAYVDPLTGVSNRAAFDQAMQQEFELAKRHGHHLSIMMLDIDNFKLVNDNYGHMIGDMVLKSFARSLTDRMRKSDAIFRYGGEEFILMLRNTELSGATLLAERMRKKIEEEEMKFDSVKLGVTTSIGVAQLEEIDDDFTRLLHRADRRLYEAKESGRNMVISESNN